MSSGCGGRAPFSMTGARPGFAGFPAGFSTPATTPSTCTWRPAGGSRRRSSTTAPSRGTLRRFTYPELRDAVSRFAGALRSLGVEKGDRVLLYMPMVPEAVIAMLACARIGAIHSVVFGGFAADELAQRIEHAAPKVVLSASCGIEPGARGRLQAAARPCHRDLEPEAGPLRGAPAPAAARLARGRARPRLGGAARSAASPSPACPCRPPSPSTSSTPRAPRACRRASCATTAGTPSRCKWSLRNVYGVEPGEVFWAASDIGWVVGHSYIVYAPLLLGLHDDPLRGQARGNARRRAPSGASSPQHGVDVLFTAPTALRAIKREDPQAELRPALRSLAAAHALPGRRAGRSRTPSRGPSARSAFR